MYNTAQAQRMSMPMTTARRNISRTNLMSFSLPRRTIISHIKSVLNDISFISLILLIVIPLPLLTTSTEAFSESISAGPHRHRLHHGNIYSRPHQHRVRRFGRESQSSSSQSPIVESFVLSRVTEPYAAYRYEDAFIAQSLENLNKPNFTRCASYQPEISEGEPVNTAVIQVEAFDPDPASNGGSVTYSIVEATTDVFTIDAKTGWIFTRKIFDRDEPAREKQVYVTVRATDNGRPQLDSVCTIRVKILDINDNKPMFDKYEYKESIPRDLPIGQVVMRISATDIDDGENGLVQYDLKRHPRGPADLEFFEIVKKNGEVKLKSRIPDSKSEFYLTAIATDSGNPPLESETNLTIMVVESTRRPPEFIGEWPSVIVLKERSVDRHKPIATLTARSNSPDQIIFFELVNGQTQPTNKEATFTLESEGNVAYLKLDTDKTLDYESVSEYTLTIRASNKYNLATGIIITIKIEDENDEKPNFTEVDSGTVLENEPAGTIVMRVRAIDNDGTAPNNEVRYYLKEEDSVLFHIDSYTGEITTRKQFDREEQDLYQIIAIAKDGAPSILTHNGLPNERPQPLKIVIADKNDNRPVFMRDEYEAEVAEDANTGSKVIEVRAKDNDTESQISYHITSGDPGNYFRIESTSTSGVIFIRNQLDYEKIQKYELTVRASDGLYDTVTKVIIKVTNVNDNLPVFERMERNVTISEEDTPNRCIFTLRAYDPDISDRTAPQDIVFFVEKGTEHFSVDNNGCVRVIKGLDRDPPNGYGYPEVSIGASDENGGPNKQTSVIQLTVTLTDINDNAPFLTNANPVVWMENQPAGEITLLTADDHDLPINGPPFTMYIDPSANQEIQDFFSISGDRDRGYHFNAKKDNFDREEKKQYLVPIVITDNGNPRQTGTSTLVVVIGDENDNPMGPGESKIFVYKYKETSSFSIGRVYVEDLDDWDLPDKVFSWYTSEPPDFTLDFETGMINMKPSAPAGTTTLKFTVRDRARGEEVTATVIVTVKQITDEAVENSGSIRFKGITKEEFVMPDRTTRKSKQDLLRTQLSEILGVPEENVDIFTVVNSPEVVDLNVLDVRYSAHNSPYYKPEKLDGIAAQNKDKLESALGLEIVMVKIDECMLEKIHCESSCTNELVKSEISYKIYTNTSSFVGVNAYIQPICACAHTRAPNSCEPDNPCLNQGICHSGPGIQSYRCDCVHGFHGPRCEQTSISFEGTGYAWFEPLSSCNDSNLNVYFTTPLEDGVIFYNGPLAKTALNVTDFISLELLKGRPLFLLDYGSGVNRLELPSNSAVNLADAKTHKVNLHWTQHEISMNVDDCSFNDLSCYVYKLPSGSNSLLNVNGPLQVGGLSLDLQKLRSSMGWQYIPSNNNFAGCISNLSLNGEYYNLGAPSYTVGNVSTCDTPFVLVQTATLGPGLNFIIILIVCILLLLILVIAIVFYRRRRRFVEEKADPHDDIRETFVNYDDEGGGEEDKDNFDLSLLQKPNGLFMPLQDMRQKQAPPPDDIEGFLAASKDRVDDDPDGLPIDDVRNYAYEGDGNSVGSLSSLASGTDDEDLNFDYLPTFGPRFKKLADMYGGQSSDDESYIGGSTSGGEPSAWC